MTTVNFSFGTMLIVNSVIVVGDEKQTPAIFFLL